MFNTVVLTDSDNFIKLTDLPESNVRPEVVQTSRNHETATCQARGIIQPVKLMIKAWAAQWSWMLDHIDEGVDTTVS
jgi:hypothetical protein